MKIVLQRVCQAQVSVQNRIVWNIGKWLLLFVGIEIGDSENDIDKMVQKILNIRIFEDENAKMNLSVTDTLGEILSVSQFTLLADTKKWNRPSFQNAENPAIAEKLWNQFNEKMAKNLAHIETGIFGADMQVNIVNDGPVTIILDSKK